MQVHGQQQVRVVTDEGVQVAQLAGSTASKAVAVLDVAVVRQVAAAAAEGAGNGGVVELADGGGGLDSD